MKTTLRLVTAVVLGLCFLSLCWVPATSGSAALARSSHRARVTRPAKRTVRSSKPRVKTCPVRACRRRVLLRKRSTARRRASARKLALTRAHHFRSAPAEPTLRAHSVGDIFGVGAFVSQRSSSVAPLVIGRAKLLGAGWVREEFTATRLHTGPDAPYDWRTYDQVIGEERRAGLQVLGLLDYSNTWAYGNHGTMPHQDIARLSADFGRFAYDVARHFRSRIQYWQVWNEPDLTTFWHPAPNPDDYARLLSVAYGAIKRANPHARVVLAGTSGMDLSFIRRVASRTHSFDLVSVHPYRNLPETSLLEQIHALRAFGKPVWFSEIGWAAGPDCTLCTDESSQASYLVRFYALAAAAGVQRVFWYDLRDDADSPWSPEAHFGLLRQDLSAKPAFVAYRLLAHLLRDATFVRADALGQNGVFVLEFRSGAEPLAIVWSPAGDSPTVGVPWTTSSGFVAGLGGGALAEAAPQHGWALVHVPAGGAPVYLMPRLPTARLDAPGALLHPPPPPRQPVVQQRASRPASRAGKSSVVSRPGKRRAVSSAGTTRSASRNRPAPARRPAGAAQRVPIQPVTWTAPRQEHHWHKSASHKPRQPIDGAAPAAPTPTSTALRTPGPESGGPVSVTITPTATSTPTPTATATPTPAPSPTPTLVRVADK